MNDLLFFVRDHTKQKIANEKESARLYDLMRHYRILIQKGLRWEKE